MKTESINYEKLYLASKIEFENAKSQKGAYYIDKLTESLAYLVALETGLRVSDLLKLKYMFFQYDKTLDKYTFTSNIQKTKSKHIGVISDETYQYIKDYRNAVNSHYTTLNEYIFFNYKTGKLYSRQWLHKRIKKVGEKLEFSNCGVHSLRKASAIKVLNETGSLSMAQYHLTHKRTTTTDKYLGVTQKTALEQLAKVFK